MKLLSCILMGIGSIIGASVFATTPIAIKIIGGNGIVVGFICAALFVFLRSIPAVSYTHLVDSDIGVLLHLLDTFLHLFLGHHFCGPGNGIVRGAELPVHIHVGVGYAAVIAVLVIVICIA